MKISRLTLKNYLFFYLCISSPSPTMTPSLSPILFPHSEENDFSSKMQNTVVSITFKDFSWPKFLPLDSRAFCEWFLLTFPEYLLLQLSHFNSMKELYSFSCGFLRPGTLLTQFLLYLANFYLLSNFTWDHTIPHKTLLVKHVPTLPPSTCMHLYSSTYYTARQVLLLIYRPV